MWIDDQILKRHLEPLAYDVFTPQEPMVVLGSSNLEDREVNLKECQTRNVLVSRRYGGGGAVILYPGCVVVSVGTWVKDPYNNSVYFRLLNQSIIEALALRWPILASLKQAGISDIVMGEKKVSGTSLFRSRNYLLYQASVIVDLDLDLVSNCLAHPSKEPDYRKGRQHQDFLTSLSSLTFGEATTTTVVNSLKENIASSLKNVLEDHLIEPVLTQTKSLEERITRADFL